MKKVLGTFSGGILDEEQSQQMSGLAYTTTGKIGFPQYIRGGLFQLFRKVPFEWEDLGAIITCIGGIGLKGDIQDFHKLCGSTLHIGRDFDKNLFKFCNRCLVKVE